MTLSGSDDWETLLPAESGAEAVRWALELSASWHRDNEGDLLSFAGISLGRAKRWHHFVELFLPAARAAAAGVPFAKSYLWTPPRLETSVLKRALAAGLNAARPPRAGDWLLYPYPSLEPIVAEGLRRGAGFAFTELPRRALLRTLAGRACVALTPAHEAFTSEQSRALEAIAERWRDRRAALESSKALVFAGRDLTPELLPRLDVFMSAELPSLAWNAAFLERRWRDAPPGLAIVPFPGPPVAQVLQQLARARGTPSALVLHGLPFSYRFPLEHPDTTHFVMWGPAQPPLYAAAALDPRVRAVPVGNPYFDRYAGSRVERAGPMRRLLLLTHPVVLTEGLSSRRDPERYARSLAERLNRVPSLEITLKLHPSESIAEYRGWVGKTKIKLVKDEPLADCLREADLVAGSFSTVLLEALLCGLPVVSVNISRDPFPPPFDGSWGIPHARSADELGALVEKALKNPDAFRAAQREPARRVIEGFAGRMDGKAAQAVVDALEKIAAGKL